MCLHLLFCTVPFHRVSPFYRTVSFHSSINVSLLSHPLYFFSWWKFETWLQITTRERSHLRETSTSVTSSGGWWLIYIEKATIWSISNFFIPTAFSRATSTRFNLPRSNSSLSPLHFLRIMESQAKFHFHLLFIARFRHSFFISSHPFRYTLSSHLQLVDSRGFSSINYAVGRRRRRAANIHYGSRAACFATRVSLDLWTDLGHRDSPRDRIIAANHLCLRLRRMTRRIRGFIGTSFTLETTCAFEFQKTSIGSFPWRSRK